MGRCRKDTMWHYRVYYTSGLTGERISFPEMGRTQANRTVKGFKQQNKLQEHNTQLIRGKNFTLYKNIKVKKVC